MKKPRNTVAVEHSAVVLRHVEQQHFVDAMAARDRDAGLLAEAEAIDDAALVAHLTPLVAKHEARLARYAASLSAIETAAGACDEDVGAYQRAVAAREQGSRDRDEAIRLELEVGIAGQRARISERELASAVSTTRATLAGFSNLPDAQQERAREIIAGIVAAVREDREIESDVWSKWVQLPAEIQRWEPIFVARVVNAENERLRAEAEAKQGTRGYDHRRQSNEWVPLEAFIAAIHLLRSDREDRRRKLQNELAAAVTA